MNSTLTRLGLQGLVGRDPIDVIGAVAEHLSNLGYGVDRDLLRKSLQDAIFELVNLERPEGYDDFSAALEQALANDGVPALLEGFLTQYTFNTLWSQIEEWVDKQTRDPKQFEALMVTFQEHCRDAVRTEISASRSSGVFDNVDWFGKGGISVSQAIAERIESALRGAAPG